MPKDMYSVYLTGTLVIVDGRKSAIMPVGTIYKVRASSPEDAVRIAVEGGGRDPRSMEDFVRESWLFCHDAMPELRSSKPWRKAGIYDVYATMVQNDDGESWETADDGTLFRVRYDV